MLEGALQLQPSAAHVAEVLAEHAEGGTVVHGGAGLLHALIGDEHAAGEDERLRAFARLHQSTLHESFVQTSLHAAVKTIVRMYVGSNQVHWTRWIAALCGQPYDSADAGSGQEQGNSPAGSNPGRPQTRFMKRETGVVDMPQPSTGDDASLLALVQSGDEPAMAALFDRYSRLVYSVALRVLRDPAAAEDVLQEVFMQIWRNPDSFSAARGSLGGWLSIVARNRSIDTLRRKRPSVDVDDVPLASSFNLADEAERNSLMERARGVIVQLPKEQRKTLEMAFFDGLTHSEIAEITGDPLGTVKTRIRSALLTLRKAFQP